MAWTNLNEIFIEKANGLSTIQLSETFVDDCNTTLDYSLATDVIGPIFPNVVIVVEGDDAEYTPYFPVKSIKITNSVGSSATSYLFRNSNFDQNIEFLTNSLVDGESMPVTVIQTDPLSSLNSISPASVAGSAKSYNGSCIAVGGSSNASGAYSTALGVAAKAAASGSTSIGYAATCTSAAEGSVAIGYRSAATEADVVSVGHSTSKSTLTRRIVNVADPTSDNDAVNLKYLNTKLPSATSSSNWTQFAITSSL